jgi:hypothetical protein
MRLADSLTEAQAMRIEVELISTFATINTPGNLTDSAMPFRLNSKTRSSVAVPRCTGDKAKIRLPILNVAAPELANVNPMDIVNSELDSLLGLRSDHGGGPWDHLSRSITGPLIHEGEIGRANALRKHDAQVRQLAVNDEGK